MKEKQQGPEGQDTLIEWMVPEVEDKTTGIIKVIGVGGGGGNAVENMYRQGVCNVAYAVCNTDSQALAATDIPVKIQLGSQGLGVGGDTAKGRAAAEESADDIRKLFGGGTQMVFVTAGMGGGTGTGAAPVIASIAREMGLLTVGVVTIPFLFEKRRRIEKALQGVEQLKKSVDALLVISNERLLEVYAREPIPVSSAFARADDILTVATKSIAEIITLKGTVNRDFCDVQTVMKDGGGAIMSFGCATGEHRILKALDEALNSPLLGNVEMERAGRLLYIVYTCKDNPVLTTELSELNSFMDTLSPDLEVLWGLYEDNTLGDAVKVIIIATGFDSGETPDQEEARQEKAAEAQSENLRRLYRYYYGSVSKSLQLPGVAEKRQGAGTPLALETDAENPESLPDAEAPIPAEDGGDTPAALSDGEDERTAESFAPGLSAAGKSGPEKPVRWYDRLHCYMERLSTAILE